MRHESQNRLLSPPQHCASVGEEASLPQTVSGDTGKCRSRGEEKKKKNKEKEPSGYTTFCESHLMLLSWFPLPWLLYQVPGYRQGLL